jgi:hypothetical protein
MKIDTVRVLGDTKATGILKTPCATVVFAGSSSSTRSYGSEFVHMTATGDVSEIILGPGLDIPVASAFELRWMDCDGKNDDDDDDGDWWSSLSKGEKAAGTPFVLPR